MEIKYDVFNTWIQHSRETSAHGLLELFYERFKESAAHLVTEDDCWEQETARRNIFIKSIIDRTESDLDEDEVKIINDHLEVLRELFFCGNKIFAIVGEIDLNLVNIETDGQINRYLKHLSIEFKKASHRVWDDLHCSLIVKSRPDLKPILDRKYFDYPGRPAGGLKDKIEDYELNDVDEYLYCCLAISYRYRSYHKRIEAKLNQENEKPMIFKVDLEKNTHRLILMYKTGVFEDLYTKYHEHLGAVKFSRLISSMLGIESDKHEGFRPSVTGLIKEMNNKHSVKIIQTQTAEIHVNSFLSEIGIEI